MNPDEYTSLDATGLASLIRNGDITAEETQKAAIAAIERVNPLLNAVAGDLFTEPLKYNSSGPFSGVPFAIKDAVIMAEGVATWEGTRILGPEGMTPDADTALMRKFREAGLATVARTRVPELAFNTATEAIAYDGKPTVNPWDTSRGTGGSSGGAAALVAARALPIAHANDGGGSIRVPAAANGLVGLKPSRGRVSLAPHYGDAISGCGIEFAVSRTVRDSAALFDAVHGSEPGEKYLFPALQNSFLTNAAEGVTKPLRIALAWDLVQEDQVVDPQVREATEDIARLLDGMGHSVDIKAPVFNNEQFLSSLFTFWAAFLAAGAGQLTALTGKQPSTDVYEHATLKTIEWGNSLSAVDLLGAEAGQNQITRAFGNFFVDYDIILTPTMLVPNMPVGHFSQNNPEYSAMEYMSSIFSNVMTGVFNVTGTPAISLPLGHSVEGWPIGIQFGAAYGRDDLLFALAGDLERARPWIGRLPVVHA